MSEPWRKAAGVLRGAIPPGETPESMIRRMRDGGEPSEWAQAVAVVNALWDQYPDGELFGWRVDGTHYTRFVGLAGGMADRERIGHGPTYVAALIDLGRRWDAARTREDGPHREDDAE